MPAKLTRKGFIERAKKRHGDKYDYSRANYKHSREKIVIGCPQHGWFEQVADNHLRYGCKVCGRGGTREERFWDFVDRSGDNDCWTWIGHTNKKGYGTFRGGKGGRMIKAHVFSWILHHGDIQKDGSYFGRLFVLHHCDNPSCVNPRHLFLGTNEDNMNDVKRRGRGVAGLTWDDVREMRRLWATGEWYQSGLGQVFGVSDVTVGLITRGETWVE